MRQYEQILNNDNYNRFYGLEGISSDALPSGYGAIPYSNSFARNKITPYPWGPRLPAVFSILANGGFNYTQDTLNTNIYNNAARGTNFTNSSIYGSLFFNFGDLSLNMNPYNFGPVNQAYIVSVTGIVNANFNNNPKACKYCTDLNKDYKVWMQRTSYSDIFGSFPDNSLQGNVSWNPTNYPCNRDIYPRGFPCGSYGESNPGTMPHLQLVLLHTPSMSGVNYIASTGNIALLFYLKDSIGSIDAGTLSTSSPFFFIKDFGNFDIYKNPSWNYQNKPNMMDDAGYSLSPSIDDIYYSSRIAGQKLIDTSGNYNTYGTCDYSNATCIVKPYKTNPFFSPKEALPNFVDRKLDTLEKKDSSFLGSFTNFYRENMLPNSYTVKEFGSVTNNIQDINCADCSGYYAQERTLKISNVYYNYPYNNYGSGFYNDIISDNRPRTSASGYSVTNYISWGTSFDVFREKFITQNTAKNFLPNLTNICEFGCDESNINGNPNITRNKYCNNTIKMDLVHKYYTTNDISGIMDGVFGWLDSYIYLGQTVVNNSTTDLSIYSPYRWKKRICDDRTSTPRNCTDYKKIGSTSYYSGFLDMNTPLFSGGWTYENWTTEPYYTSTNSYTYIKEIVDVSGLCNFINSDPIISIEKDFNRYSCIGKTSCNICYNLQIPTTATIQLDSSDIFILNLNQSNILTGSMYNDTRCCSFGGGLNLFNTDIYGFGGDIFTLLGSLTSHDSDLIAAQPVTSCINWNVNPTVSSLNETWLVNSTIPIPSYIPGNCSNPIYASGTINLTCFDARTNPTTYTQYEKDIVVKITFGDFIDGTQLL